MKNIISYFIKYPVAVNIMLIAVFILGFFGFKSLNSSFFPLQDSNVISISVAYPGASPLEVEEGITTKIEDNLRGIIGIDRVTSVSSENQAKITIEKTKDQNIDALLADVNNAVDKIASFPKNIEPPIISKKDNLSRAVYFALTGKNIPLKSLKIAARDIETDLKDNYDITQIELDGFPEEEIEIAISEAKLLAYNISFETIADAISKSNILTSGGSIKTSNEDYLIRAKNKFYFAEEIDNIIIKSDASGNIVRLKDVAKITNKWEESPNRLYYNGEPVIEILVQSNNNENMLNLAQNALDFSEKFNKTHNNIQLEVTNNRSLVVKQRSQLLFKNGWQGMLLVFILLSLFLKPRLAFWVAVGLPVSFMGMFMLAPYFGFTINVLSLFGMIIVIGILVDDGIVIVENIYHHFEKGKSPIQAAIDGTLEVSKPIFSAVLTTIVAFSMFFFVEGRVGEYFSDVALVVLLTLSISLMEALIILPSHIAHSKALSKEQKILFFNKYADNFMQWMKNKLYIPFLSFFLKYKILGFAIPFALLILTVSSIKSGVIGTSFFPNIASDKLIVTLKMPAGTNENITDSIINTIQDKVWLMNEEFTKKQTGNLQVVHNVVKKLGPGTATASITINLLKGEERDLKANIYSTALDSMIGKVVGVESIEIGSGTIFGGKPLSISLSSKNISDIKAAKEELKEKLLNDGVFLNVSDNDPMGIKEINIKLKESAYLLGFSYGSIMKQIRNGFYGLEVQRLQLGQDELKVWVRYDKKTRSSIINLDEMKIIATNGSRIPLRELVTYTIERGETVINHLDYKREITVSSELRDPNASASDELKRVREDYLAPILAKYPTIKESMSGQARIAKISQNSIKKTLPIIIFIIYMIIVFTFRSFSQPLILLLLIPFSLIGVGWGHWLLGFNVNILSFLGIIALMGIVVNDGLVFIEKFNGNLREGFSFEHSLLEAGKSRFRAIFLTSITTVAGLFPLIFLENSRQANFLKPMAISVSFGIMVATIITLVLLPIMLSFSNTLKVYVKYLYDGKKPTEEEVERAMKEMD